MLNFLLRWLKVSGRSAEKLCVLDPEAAVHLIDSGVFDPLLLAVAGPERPITTERFADMLPFSREHWEAKLDLEHRER